ncbi:hypothetical protein WUBG_17292, partial [Wuchereria bancrofti]
MVNIQYIQHTQYKLSGNSAAFTIQRCGQEWTMKTGHSVTFITRSRDSHLCHYSGAIHTGGNCGK